MSKGMLPFNIDLLVPTQNQLESLGRVTSHEIFEGVGGSFHDEGLFSTQIFGRLGTNERESKFGYIKLGLDILHPVVYRNLLRLRAFYEQVITGKAFAIFDEKEKDFVVSNEIEGQTGFYFFLQHWEKIEFKENNSPIRKNRLALINKYRDRSKLNSFLVCPAAYREAEIDHTGRTTYDEVNEHYRHLLSLSFGIPDRFSNSEDFAMYDRKRLAMQLTVLEIYAHFEKLLFGKKGFIQDKWAARRVFNGTRNVISSLDTTTKDLNSPNRPKFKDAVTGLYQTVVGVRDRTIYHLKEIFLNEIFNSYSNTVQLVNPKTLKLEWVELPTDELNLWSTLEGNERLVDELAVIPKRSRPVTLNGYYLYLIYLDNDSNFKLVRNIDDVPEHINRKLIRPITYGEMFYIALLPLLKDLVGFITRYPVENYNSSFPVNFYVKTTTKGQLRYWLNDNWERDDSLPLALEFPIISFNQTDHWHDSTSMSPAMLSPLGADKRLSLPLEMKECKLL